MNQNVPHSDRIASIEAKIKYKFKRASLLENAFVHRSYFLDKKKKGQEDNERLEFLGDSVLSLIITSFLYEYCPDMTEGILTQLKEQIVDTSSLKEYIEKLDVSSHCLVGKGEEKTIQESSILANLFEAILGAIYLDGGFGSAYDFFMVHFKEIVEKKIASPKRNWKKELQERVQKELHELPEYVTEEQQGPPHKRQFKVSVKVKDTIVGRGTGMSKKEAEMQAAKDAVQRQENE